MEEDGLAVKIEEGGEMWLGFRICEDVWGEKRENGKVEDGSEGMSKMKVRCDFMK